MTAAQVDETQVAMDLADETTLNPSEAMMAIRQLRKILLRRLLGGESVKLGNWDSFNITLSSTGAETKEAVTARNIKGVNLNFQPDEAFKTDLQKTTFAWVDKLAEGRAVPPAPAPALEDHGNSSFGEGSGETPPPAV